MRVILLLVRRRGELPLLVIDSGPAFWVDSMGVLSDHGVGSTVSRPWDATGVRFGVDVHDHLRYHSHH